MTQKHWLCKSREIGVRRCCSRMSYQEKGMVHEHGAAAMVSDIERLGYKEVMLKCDGEPAMKSAQEEVKRRRMDPDDPGKLNPWR